MVLQVYFQPQQKVCVCAPACVCVYSTSLVKACKVSSHRWRVAGWYRILIGRKTRWHMPPYDLPTWSSVMGEEGINWGVIVSNGGAGVVYLCWGYFSDICFLFASSFRKNSIQPHGLLSENCNMLSVSMHVISFCTCALGSSNCAETLTLLSRQFWQCVPTNSGNALRPR